MKKYSSSIIMWIIFETIAIVLCQVLDNIFYLFNFSYIGTSIAVGPALFANKKKYARHDILLIKGGYNAC